MNPFETTVRLFKRGLGLKSSSHLVASVRPAYDFLLSNLYGKGGLSRVIGGDEAILVRVDCRNIAENYEPALYRYLRSSVRPGGTILDVGAHVGEFSILMARWAGSEGHVYAFEPTPVTRTALEDHLTLNEVEDRISVIPMAVSDDCGTAEFYVVSDSPENTLSQKHTRLPGAEKVTVKVTTIDAFCAERRLVPRLIKMDIEGFELHALRGARETLLSHRPLVVVEMHPMNWPEIGVDRSDIAGLINSIGYSVVGLEAQSDPLGEYGHVALSSRGGQRFVERAD
jgi:FkbM family methyltransferase